MAILIFTTLSIMWLAYYSGPSLFSSLDLSTNSVRIHDKKTSVLVFANGTVVIVSALFIFFFSGHPDIVSKVDCPEKSLCQ